MLFRSSQSEEKNEKVNQLLQLIKEYSNQLKKNEEKIKLYENEFNKLSQNLTNEMKEKQKYKLLYDDKIVEDKNWINQLNTDIQLLCEWMNNYMVVYFDNSVEIPDIPLFSPPINSENLITFNKFNLNLLRQTISEVRNKIYNKQSKYENIIQQDKKEQIELLNKIDSQNKNIAFLNKDISNLKDEIIVKKVKQIDDKPKFVELINPHRDVLNKLDINIDLSIEDFENAKIVKYLKYDVGVSSLIDKLTDEELVLLSLGDIKGGVSSMIGNSCSKVMGGAGETTLKIKSIPETLAMCDGPAGIRITKEYVISKGKNYAISVDPLWEELSNYIPKFIMNMIFNAKKNAKRSGERIYQYATSIPVASALAQSFSSDVISICGDIIREEMEIYNVDLWLAPAMNIHRHPLCGRNFEYYSEDPYLTGFCASTIINSVQKNTHKGTVIKHFVGNNQETNRTNSSSNMSIRALREIYLSGFKTAIEKSHPVGVMASYNLVNGAHVSENYDIINDQLYLFHQSFYYSYLLLCLNYY